MCRALQGQATALPKAPAARSSSNRPAASLALLHGGSRAWCWVVKALEPHSSALRVYDRGENTALTVLPADLEALHLGVLSGDGGTALYLQGTVVASAAVRCRRQNAGDAFFLVMAENMAPLLRAVSTARWNVEGDREKFTDAWRRWVEEQFPLGMMRHLPQPPSVPPVRPAAPLAPWRRRSQKQRLSRLPRRASPTSMAATPTLAMCCGTSEENWPRSSVGQRSSTSAPGPSLRGRAIARGGPANTCSQPTFTPRTSWTMWREITGQTQLSVTRRWP